MNVTIFFLQKELFYARLEMNCSSIDNVNVDLRRVFNVHCGLIKCFLKSAEAQRKTSIQKRKEKIRLFSVKEAQSRD